MKKTIIIITLILISSISFGQEISLNRDTLIIKINEDVTLRVSSYNNPWLIDYKEIGNIIDTFLLKLNLVKNELLIYENYLIKYDYPTEKMIIRINDPSNHFFVDRETLIPITNNKCHIHTWNFDIYIDFKKTEDLFNSEIQDCLNRAVLDINKKQKGGFSHIAWTVTYSCQNDTLIFEGGKWNPHKSELGIKLGVGIGIVKSNISPDFGFRIGHYRTIKGILKHNIYLSDNLMYTFQPDNKMRIHNFVNVGYRYNLSNEIDKYNWIGFEIGYLTNGQDLIETPTIRLSTLINLHKNITISPQIYFENGFKKVYPGLRFGINIGP